MIIAFFYSTFSYSQSSLQKFKSVSFSEKCWVIFHPFVAKKAMKKTSMVLSDVDSVKNTGTIGTDMNGGKLDAFRHAYWMATLTNSIGKHKSLKLGKAHEKGNYRTFKKHKLEDSILPDSVSCEMDLMNNKVGADLVGEKKRFGEKKDIQNIVLESLKTGKLSIIKKDKGGNYLYCDGTFIDTNVWGGKWNIPKCLISSDQN
ncbi:MAG: hypothetical protein K0Q95_1610 [Bacteroidota bacterium]|jgi:hypothetical protein|nr:hypothetical protein [Bacteroidota bacterium]